MRVARMVSVANTLQSLLLVSCRRREGERERGGDGERGRGREGERERGWGYNRKKLGGVNNA